MARPPHTTTIFTQYFHSCARARGAQQPCTRHDYVHSSASLLPHNVTPFVAQSRCFADIAHTGITGTEYLLFAATLTKTAEMMGCFSCKCLADDDAYCRPAAVLCTTWGRFLGAPRSAPRRASAAQAFLQYASRRYALLPFLAFSHAINARRAVSRPASASRCR